MKSKGARTGPVSHVLGKLHVAIELVVNPVRRLGFLPVDDLATRVLVNLDQLVFGEGLVVPSWSLGVKGIRAGQLAFDQGESLPAGQEADVRLGGRPLDWEA